MRNKRTFLGLLTGLLVLALPAAIFISRPQVQSPPAPHSGSGVGTASLHPAPAKPVGTRGMGALAERKHKQHLLNADVELTNQLCRSQCRIDLGNMAVQMKGKDRKAIHSHLTMMRREHPHMERLEWISSKGKAIVSSGRFPAAVRKEAQRQLKLAAESVRRGSPYESTAIKDQNGESYFVLGIPDGTKKQQGIVGLVHQDILGKIANHQKRNLRLTPFPDERHFGIRAVDPETGKEMDVDTAEENQGISHYRLKEVVVRFKNEPSEQELNRIKKEIGAVRVQKLGYAFVFEAKEKSTKDMLKYFQAKDITYAEPHYLYVTNQSASALANPIVPNDDLYSRYQWNLPMIQTPAGWQLTRGNEQVTVAVIDTGVDLTHPDLQGQVVKGYNVIDPSKPPEDDVGHGTHVAGVISALTDNGEGVAGMTWFNRIMPVKVLDSTGMGSTYAVAQGIIWAADHGAKVINMSLGNYASAEFLHDAIKYAFDKDIVLIAATGNDNTSQPGYPAAYEEVFGVSATNAYREKASFSNYGNYVDVVAPGENIASTYMQHQYAALSGTSMASPHTAALAALIRSANPKLKNTEVYDIMRKSAEDLGPQGKDDYFGYGQIDVVRALELATGKPAQATPEMASDEGVGRRTFDGSGSFLDWLLSLLSGSSAR